MICKFCGEIIVEGKCSKCGKVAVLEGRSTELERLLQRNSAKEQKSDDQDYQRGFQEGYKNGLNDGVVKCTDSQTLVEGIPVMETVRFLPFILAAILFLALTPLSFFCYSKGVKKGEHVAAVHWNEELVQARKLEYNKGYSEGEVNGWKSALSSAEVKLLIEKAFQDGIEEGIKKSEAETSAEQGLEAARKDAVHKEEKADDILYSLEDQNSEKEEVKIIQQKLIDLGYLENGSADGYFGDKTLVAIRQFQENCKIPITESGIDRRTCELLLSTVVPGDQNNIAIVNADDRELN